MPFSPPPSGPESEPAWFHTLSRLVLRLGPARATIAMTLVVTVASVALAEGVLRLSIQFQLERPAFLDDRDLAGEFQREGHGE